MVTADDLAGFRRGEPDAVRAVYRDYGGLVFAVVRRTGGDRGPVELAWCAALAAAAAHAGVRVLAVAAVGRDRARVLQWERSP